MYVHCVSKTPIFYFLHNSEKNQPILITSGIQNSEKFDLCWRNWSPYLKMSWVLHITRYGGDISLCGGQVHNHLCEVASGFCLPKTIQIDWFL